MMSDHKCKKMQARQNMPRCRRMNGDIAEGIEEKDEHEGSHKRVFSKEGASKE